MKILRKHVVCGEYEFDVAIDREIATDAMEAFPDLCEYMFTTAKQNLNKKGDKVDEVDLLIDNIRNKKLREMWKYESQLGEMVKYAFPKMLKKAGSDLDAQKIIDYIYENEVDGEFNGGMFEFIVTVFTQREATAKKKVSFSMT